MGIATAAAAIPSQALLASTRFTTQNNISNGTESQDISDLRIEILTSDTVNHNTVILTNLSDQTIQVKHFRPGSVIWDDQYLDLNGLRGHVGLSLTAGSEMHLSVHRKKIKYSFQSEYIWADDAMAPVDKHTNRILLGAFMADGHLHAYPIPAIHKFT